MFINKEFTISFTKDSVVLNKDVVERLGEIPTEFFKVYDKKGSIFFEESPVPEINTVRVIHNEKSNTLKIASTDVPKYVRSILNIRSVNFKIGVEFKEEQVETKGIINNVIELKKELLIKEG